MFPILGGRLLKWSVVERRIVKKMVSNPWREAIEVEGEVAVEEYEKVSNPWREAIEGVDPASVKKAEKSFQSLEGGY